MTCNIFYQPWLRIKTGYEMKELFSELGYTPKLELKELFINHGYTSKLVMK
jgi:hypothetical protein